MPSEVPFLYRVGYLIVREREVSSWPGKREWDRPVVTEYQIWRGRKIVARCETRQQVRVWLAESGAAVGESA